MMTNATYENTRTKRNSTVEQSVGNLFGDGGGMGGAYIT